MQTAKSLTVIGLGLDVIGVMLIFIEWFKHEFGNNYREQSPKQQELLGFQKEGYHIIKVDQAEVDLRNAIKWKRQRWAVWGVALLLIGFVLQIIAQFL